MRGRVFHGAKRGDATRIGLAARTWVVLWFEGKGAREETGDEGERLAQKAGSAFAVRIRIANERPAQPAVNAFKSRRAREQVGALTTTRARRGRLERYNHSIFVMCCTRRKAGVVLLPGRNKRKGESSEYSVRGVSLNETPLFSFGPPQRAPVSR